MWYLWNLEQDFIRDYEKIYHQQLGFKFSFMKINYRTDKDKKSAVCEKKKVGGNLVPVPMIFILKIKQPRPKKSGSQESK